MRLGVSKELPDDQEAPSANQEPPAGRTYWALV